jgi:hypothetical protein
VFLFIHCDHKPFRPALFVEAQIAPSFAGVFDLRQRPRLSSAALSVPSSTEDAMRIFERLRGRSGSDSAIERKLFEAITDDLLRKFADGTSAPVFTDDKAHCCSCCSAEEKPAR